jgi:hypothetical protein
MTKPLNRACIAQFRLRTLILLAVLLGTGCAHNPGQPAELKQIILTEPARRTLGPVEKLHGGDVFSLRLLLMKPAYVLVARTRAGGETEIVYSSGRMLRPSSDGTVLIPDSSGHLAISRGSTTSGSAYCVRVCKRPPEQLDDLCAATNERTTTWWTAPASKAELAYMPAPDGRYLGVLLAANGRSLTRGVKEESVKGTDRAPDDCEPPIRLPLTD